MASVVTVLTPNGRRQNVKVQPNKTVLQILDEVCQKHNFQSSEYDLRHHKRILDLSLMFRFTGLPNNAQLEMVKVLKLRQESDVVLMIQFEDGSRKSDSFHPDVTLINVLQKLCPEKCSEPDLVLIYMRTDIHGSDLTTTTLRSLGLTGGRAMFRLVQRQVDSLKTQANVTRIIPASTPIHPVERSTFIERKIEKVVQKNAESSDASMDQCETVPVAFMDDQVESPEANDIKRVKYDETVDLLSPSTSSHGAISNPESTQMEVEEEPEVLVIGERNAILFSLNDSQPTTYENEVKDSFFDLTVNDIKVLLRDLRTHSHELENAPLMTTKMREMEHDNQTMLKLNRYRSTIIRIQFPSRLVLQGIFLPSDTIQLVMNFVRSFLSDSNLDFHLYLTPPKKILDKETTLVENHCVPMALLHFGSKETCDNTNLIRDEFLDKVSTYKAAIWAASKSRGFSLANAGLENSESAASKSSDLNRKQQSAGSESFITSSAVSNMGTKVPKWFKPTGK